MAYKLVKRNKLRVPVKGTFADEDGKPVNFSYVLFCLRLTQTEIEEAIGNSDESVTKFVKRVVTGWEDVIDELGAPLPFDDVNLANVLEQPGMPVVCYQRYLKEIGAVAKN
jgi:hypothetical protein